MSTFEQDRRAAPLDPETAPQVDVIVPVYNEGHVLDANITRLHHYLRDRFPVPWRITIADNASTDDTWKIAQSLHARYPRVHGFRLEQKGRGRALKATWLASDADVVAYMDVDLSTDLDALLPLVAPLLSGHSDLAIGTRLAPGSRVVRGPKREFISRTYNRILRVVLGTQFRDAQCGFKAVRSDVARALLPSIENNNWFFDTELLVTAERNGLRIAEVPVDWTDDPDSRVDVVHTAVEDLRGVLRLARTFWFHSERANLEAVARRDAPAGAGDEFVRFLTVGAVCTGLYLAAFLALQGSLGPYWANAVALTATMVINTSAHRRYTFRRRGKGSHRHLDVRQRASVRAPTGVGVQIRARAADVHRRDLPLTTIDDPVSESNLEEDSGAPEVPVARLTARQRIVGWRPETVVVLAAFVINTWALSQNGYGNAYYAATVRSMGTSVHNFLYGSYDPGGWITTDKPPFPYWIDTVFTKIFGFSSWTLLLPSAICGAAAVALLIATLRPVWGRAAGIAGGVALALTPAMVAVSRSNNPDATLVLLTVAATWATTHALRKGSTRWLIAAAVFVALAFLSKLLAGFVALPGLWLAYLIAGPGAWKRRIAQLVGATVVIAVITIGWIGFMDLSRPDGQPYVGSSADGSARDLVLGYNGFGRILGQAGPGGAGAGFPIGPGMIIGNNGIDQFGGTPGATRLFNNGMGDQIMWLLPAGLVAGAAAIVIAVRQRKRDAQLGTAIAFLSWLLITGAVFSTAKGIFHNYYVSLLAPPLAGLVGVGVSLARSTGRIGRLVTAVTLAATAAMQLVLLERVDAWTWLRVVVPAGLGIAAIALIFSLVPAARRRSSTIVLGSIAAAFVIASAAPAAWSLGTLQRPANGTFPDARPFDAGGIGSSAMPLGGGGGGGNPFGGIPEAELSWLRQQHGSERWILAVGASFQASDAIAGGDSIMAMGGFMGSDPAMTKSKLADLVDRGELRFISTGGLSFGGDSAVSSIVAQVCTAVPASNWGSNTPMSGVYDCQGKGTDIRNAADTPPAATNLPRVPGGGLPGGGGFPNGGGFPGGGQPGSGGLPGGIPANLTPEQMQFGMCVLQHGGNPQDLLGIASGGKPSAQTQAAIDQCGGLPPGPPPSIGPPPQGP